MIVSLMGALQILLSAFLVLSRQYSKSWQDLTLHIYTGESQTICYEKTNLTRQIIAEEYLYRNHSFFAPCILGSYAS